MAQKKVRMLVASQVEGVDYAANQVIELDEKLAKPMVKEGVADDSSEAVAYCIEQGAEVVKHTKPKAEKPAADEAN